MFFRKKKENEERLLENGRQLSQKLQAVENQIEAEGRRLGEQFVQMNRGLEQLQAEVRKQDMSMEDLLETWEEKQAGEAALAEQVSEYRLAETSFLGLFEAYEEQFQNLRRFAEKDEAWAKQFMCMEAGLERSLASCGIQVIEECGVLVDYDLHEVLRVTDTEDENQDGRVAEVYRFGYWYKGAVRRKAQVAAYRKNKGDTGR